MATTSTNKQPLLIDRPLHQQVFLTNSITGNADFWLTNNACTVLVDCTNNDGALIEDIYAISRDATARNVSMFLYNSVTNLRENDTPSISFVGRFATSATAGDMVHFDDMPYVLAPGPSVSIGGANTRDSGQFKGLYIPKGYALWVGLAQVAATAQPAIADAPVVGASGGYY